MAQIKLWQEKVNEILKKWAGPVTYSLDQINMSLFQERWVGTSLSYSYIWKNHKIADILGQKIKN